jgi:hypothetical protein
MILQYLKNIGDEKQYTNAKSMGEKSDGNIQ